MASLSIPEVPLRVRGALGWILLGAACFYGAYQWDAGILVVGFALAAMELARLPSARLAFYGGTLLGLLAYAPQLTFFQTIFGYVAISLWCVLAAWLGLFTALAQQARQILPGPYYLLSFPVLWMGVEYFRGEGYYLRFTWLSLGFSVPPSAVSLLGVYGFGFTLVLLLAACPACAVALACTRRPFRAGGAYALLCHGSKSMSLLNVTGVQLEFPTTAQVLQQPDVVAESTAPRNSLVVFSECTFDGPVPDAVRAWCVEHQMYLIAGG